MLQQCTYGNNNVKTNCSTENVSLDQELLNSTNQSKAASSDDSLQNNYRLLVELLIKPEKESNMVMGGGRPFLEMDIRDGHGIYGASVSSAKVQQEITLDVIMQDTSWLFLFLGMNSTVKHLSVLRLLRAQLLRSRRNGHARSEHQDHGPEWVGWWYWLYYGSRLQ